MRGMLLVAGLALLLSAKVARADDRTACVRGDDRACQRIGELKREGALNADFTKNVDRLVDACGKALDAASGPDAMREVGTACGQLFNRDMQRSWSALGRPGLPEIDRILGDAYAEAYCPVLEGPHPGCHGRRAANFSELSEPKVREALRRLNAAALEKELGAEKAKGLVAKFDRAWSRLLGARR